MQFGGFWIRVGAYLIDIIILLVAASIIQGVTGINMGANWSAAVNDAAFSGGTDESSPLGNLVGLIVGIAYFAGLESSSWQATVGKKAVGLVVTDLSGNRISFLRALGRYFAKILSGIILLIGYIMVAFTEKKQGLHDMLASTLVVKGKPGEHGTTGVFD
ncbi:RDD family protein [Aurantiacibacter sp. MUD11]|uniref:RDD family protein n=1 Tax=Aurantiacibacter sp. MUD11 TaxID=3003265 RepID=UPI0022AA1C38|nr:RDD family protein [Aurantiacibacter sp. MUD11]WAT19008.1 RDD family protein [Aurantiacibacter sp. MUD11]